MPGRIWLRRPRRRRETRIQLVLSAVIGVGLALAVIHCCNAMLRPQLTALAEVKVRNRLTVISNQAVLDELNAEDLSYSDVVTLQTKDGIVTTLTTNTAQLNRLRIVVIDDIIPQVEELDSLDLGIPFGALTGIDLLSSFGPLLPVRVLSVSSADAVYRNDFTDAGINQTLHRIMLDVSITAHLLFPSGVIEIQVATPVCVAETIIVGQVPEAYLNYNQ